MKTKKIYDVILLTMIVLIFFLLFNFLSISFADGNNCSKGLEYSLSDIDIAIDLLQIWNNKYKHDNILGDKVKQLILTKILLLRSASPDLKNIKWDQLDSINRMIDFVKKNDLSIKGDCYIESLASEYLLSIESDVKEILKARENERIKFKRKVKNRLGEIR